ncbi:putative esterase [Lachnellula subtilissima]|uniref:Putative esterase n=1 Tax=Lachnellula subtilissima TaxID=602034 RepID=A0A8H8RJH4_9HELO|nr:putative esterase [Lachnellula subtilissima]
MAALRFVRSPTSVQTPMLANANVSFSVKKIKALDRPVDLMLTPKYWQAFWRESAEPGRVEFELDISKEHTFTVDLGGSLAVASRGLYATGVSTDLNGEFCLVNLRKTIDLRIFLVTYLNSGGQVGDILKAIVKCDKFGKTLAYTSIEFINGKGDIAARGSHTNFTTVTKFFTLLSIWQIRRQAWKHPENIVEQLSPRK